jgi:hypothetical protein
VYVVVVMVVFSLCCRLDFCGGLSEIGLSFGSNFGPFFPARTTRKPVSKQFVSNCGKNISPHKLHGRKGKKEKEEKERRKKPINPTNIIFWSVKKLQLV